MARKRKSALRRRAPSRLAQLKVRLPKSLRRDLEYAAGYANHSMNTEIVKRLTEFFHKFHRTKLIARALLREIDDEIIDEIVRLRGDVPTDIKDKEVAGIMEEAKRHDIEEEVRSVDIWRQGSPKDEEPK